MSTQSSYTTLSVSRFGFSVLSVTLNRVNTQDVKAVACKLLAAATIAQDDDHDHISKHWDESLSNEQQYSSFLIDADGDYSNAYHCSIRQFDITDNQVREAVHASRDTSVMFF